MFSSFTGNILVIAALSLKARPLSSTTFYLITLAAADLTVCVVGQMIRNFPRAVTGNDIGKVISIFLSYFLTTSKKEIAIYTFDIFIVYDYVPEHFY